MSHSHSRIGYETPFTHCRSFPCNLISAYTGKQISTKVDLHASLADLRAGLAELRTGLYRVLWFQTDANVAAMAGLLAIVQVVAGK